ncbi:hypothetical protein BD780_000875 [Clostridium tetanomorphum]|uniref:Lipoprotein n=1 Tax=Clostridium tetanomorphum TaxID=1553 RepID=A0A923E974_CLOTT|nr:hypothetical protein [Clostridium tetanomorphum]KAJ48729.1 hypothetical protein CTM_26730 [Clostridium tetanomorphum DSM 665]KAJ53103.1 hypothetical protein CTM_04195 [Clostridium tetanomorphum DSM 665]MBC2398790.1 hypothetical protein [Clostridium tetanomorphum]MBP1863551.1 hypothetical protein [Clostridium tetanomorphum]NRS83650.1 hypothetical protein [Clostridium tetanomorphum]
MKAKFLKKEIVLVTLSLLFSNILIGCSTNKSTTDSYNKPNSSISQEGKKEISKDSSKEVNSTEKLEKDEKYKNNVSPEKAKVSSKVKLYKGIYFDDRRFGDNILNLKTYCEVAISNITDTSFDFTIYEVDAKTENKKVIFLTNTAVFTGDGTKAAFYGKNYTLHFTFPDNHKAYPAVTDMEISGFEPLKSRTYVNNGVPGHEFS